MNGLELLFNKVLASFVRSKARANYQIVAKITTDNTSGTADFLVNITINQYTVKQVEVYPNKLSLPIRLQQLASTEPVRVEILFSQILTILRNETIVYHHTTSAAVVVKNQAESGTISVNLPQ